MKEFKELKLMNSKEVKTLDMKKLKEEIKSASKKMFELKAKLNVNELKQTHLIKFLRKYIAQLKTVETSKLLES